MGLDDECLHYGMDELVEFTGIPRATLRRNYLADMKRRGVVLKRLVGRPPTPRLAWFPSAVKRYIAFALSDTKWLPRGPTPGRATLYPTPTGRVEKR